MPKSSVVITNNIPQLAASLDDIINRSAGKGAAFIEAKLIDRINEQDSRWPPLSEKYQKWKEKMGFSELAWVQTGELRELITFRVVESGATSEIQVGIFNHFKGFIAHVLEYGAANAGIPERPLFRPVVIENKDEVIKLIRDSILEEFSKHYVSGTKI